jgi:hypothetical protein
MDILPFAIISEKLGPDGPFLTIMANALTTRGVNCAQPAGTDCDPRALNAFFTELINFAKLGKEISFMNKLGIGEFEHINTLGEVSEYLGLGHIVFAKYKINGELHLFEVLSVDGKNLRAVSERGIEMTIPFDGEENYIGVFEFRGQKKQ